MIKFDVKVKQKIVINGVEYGSPEEIPDDLRKTYEMAMAKAGIKLPAGTGPVVNKDAKIDISFKTLSSRPIEGPQTAGAGKEVIEPRRAGKLRFVIIGGFIVALFLTAMARATPGLDLPGLAVVAGISILLAVLGYFAVGNMRS